MLSQFQDSESKQSALRSNIQKDLNLALDPLIQKYMSKMKEEEKINFLIELKELFCKKVLLDVRNNQNINNNAGKTEEIIERKKALIDKWKPMDDLEEGRRVLGIYGVQEQLLASNYSSMLIDDLEIFKKTWEKSQNNWKSMLEMSCLLGSRKIGNFIFENKAENLSEKDYGGLLSYIALSSNEDWAYEFAKQMKERSYNFPDSIYNYSIDLGFVQDIQKVFESKTNKIVLS